MEFLFKDGRLLPEKVIKIIEGIFHRCTGPIFMGIVSLEIGWNLQRTQEMFDILDRQGTIRAATQAEKKEAGLRPDAHVYVLAVPRSLVKAHPNW